MFTQTQKQNGCIMYIMLCYVMLWKYNNSVFFQIGSHVLAYSNSCVNPILYAFLSPPFRAGFVKLLPCMRDRSAVEETITLARMQTSKVKKRKDKKLNK